MQRAGMRLSCGSVRKSLSAHFLRHCRSCWLTCAYKTQKFSKTIVSKISLESTCLSTEGTVSPASVRIFWLKVNLNMRIKLFSKRKLAEFIKKTVQPFDVSDHAQISKSEQN